MALSTIGLLIDRLDNDYASSLAFAFHDEVCGRGMRFLCFVGHELAAPGEPEHAGNMAYHLASARVLDGLVVVSLGTKSSFREQMRYLERYRPLPMCSLVINNAGIPNVSVDNAGGMRDAVRHLIQVHGRRLIAFVRGPEGLPDADLRYAGYLAALAEHGIEQDARLVVSGDFQRESGALAVRVLLDQRRVKFDALVGANDTMAAGAMVELSARGARVPEDVAICGFDDVEESRFSNPPISSVRQPWRARARVAVDLILLQRSGDAVEDQLVPAEFVPRRSCGCGVNFKADVLTGAGGLERRVANWDWRKATASGLARDLWLRGIHIADAPARGLVECYWEEVEGQREGGFMLLLDQELAEQLRERSSLSAWYHGLARLRLDVLDRLEGNDARAKAEALMHAAFERVSYAAERQQALRRLAFERQCRMLVLAGQATSTAFDTEGMSAPLRQQLPELGLPRFYVSQYEADETSEGLPARSRLVIVHEDEPANAAPATRVFETLLLVPPGAWPADAALGFVVEALHFQNERLGFAVFQIGPRQGAIYMALREQLSAALKGVSLVKQVAQRALQREQAERARMQEELRIARRVQISILPTVWQVPGMDVAAAMLPGQLPGADYFDIRPDALGAWLALGSVRGGGLGAGLMIPMLQSIVASLCQGLSILEPLPLLKTAMLVLQENVEVRMRGRQYVNLLVARYSRSGRVQFAADFEGVTLCPWHGSPFRPEFKMLGETPQGEPLLGGEFQLSPHDLLLLYTQGLTRSSDFEDAPIGDERIGRELERNRASPVEKIRDDMLSTVQRWSGKRADLSVIVGRRLGPG
jgi:sigma-B regulation protein RsbU (phosphoserine phosphatase)